MLSEVASRPELHRLCDQLDTLALMVTESWPRAHSSDSITQVCKSGTPGCTIFTPVSKSILYTICSVKKCFGKKSV